MSDKAKKNIFQRAIGAIADAAKWVIEQLREDTTRNAVYADLGLAPPNPPPVMPDMTEHFDSIDAYRKKQDPDAEALKAAVEDIKAIKNAIRGFVNAGQGSGVSDEIFNGLILLMSSNYIRLRFPRFYWIAQPLGFVGDAMSIGAIPKVDPKDVAVDVKDGFVEFVKGPKAYLEERWPDLETEEDARLLSHAIFAPLAIAFTVFQKGISGEREVQVLYGWEPGVDSTTPIGDRLSKRMLSFAYVTPTSAGFPAVQGTMLATLAFVPREQGGPGLFVSLGGTAEMSTFVDGWRISSKLGSASAVSMMVNSLRSASGPADASVDFTIARVPDPAALPYTVSLGKRARLDLGDFAFTAGVGTQGPRLRLATGKSAFVLAADSDAVVERGMPQDADAFRLDFDFALGLANGQFSIEGGNGLQVTLPVAKKLGPVEARGLTLGLVPSTETGKPAFAFAATATIVIGLGPVTLTLDRIGLEAGVSREWDLSAGFHSPNGIAVMIKSETVSGGGSISFDPVAHQYSGMLMLSIKDKVTLSAIGILNTRIDDKPAFSFLIMINATGFPPISLGLGFKLTGVGGLLGLDREVNLPALEAGVTNKTLDRILFPVDPIAHAAEIVKASSTVFPPKRGQTIFGPMLQITWGASSLVRIELAVIIQIPSVRLVILGKLRAFFPTEAKPVLKIQIDLVGTFDFDRKRAFAQANLVASKLAGFTLSGGAAMLLYWGDNSTYLLSFGGFNPHYAPQVPAEFPKLPRLALGLAQRENLKLAFTLYVAVTSNSFQIGGSFSVFAKKGKFSIEGLISADALFQSSKPEYTFDLVAKLQLKAFGTNLFMVKLEGTLTGSDPWRAVGKVTFEIWIFDYSISIDHTFGDEDTPAQLPAVDVAALVRTELADLRNWTTDVPAAARSLVTFRDIPAGQMVLHPLGTLNIVQRIAPLNVTISRFGENRPQGTTSFGIDQVKVGNDIAPKEDVKEQFARAQFIEMTQDEKLATPAFEKLNAGVRINAAAMRNGPVVEATTEYTTLIWDAARGEAVVDQPYSLKTDLLLALAFTSAAAKATRSNGEQYRGPSRAVAIGSVAYVIASTDDLVASSTPATYTAARSQLKTVLAANPQQRGKIQILPVAR